MLQRGIGNGGLAIDQKEAGTVSALRKGSGKNLAEKVTVP
jgi:hypothetical protein